MLYNSSSLSWSTNMKLVEFVDKSANAIMEDHLSDVYTYIDKELSQLSQRLLKSQVHGHNRCTVYGAEFNSQHIMGCVVQTCAVHITWDTVHEPKNSIQILSGRTSVLQERVERAVQEARDDIEKFYDENQFNNQFIKYDTI